MQSDNATFEETLWSCVKFRVDENIFELILHIFYFLKYLVE